MVIFTAEDDKDEVHRRLEQIDPKGDRRNYKGKLFVIPMPNAGGPNPLVRSNKGTYEPTDFYHQIRRQLLKIDDLKLINFDPMASFVQADILREKTGKKRGKRFVYWEYLDCLSKGTEI